MRGTVIWLALALTLSTPIQAAYTIDLPGPDASLAGATSGAQFGDAVDMDVNYTIVGAPDDDASAINTETGAAYIYAPDGQGGWTQEAQLVAGDAGQDDQFGASVAIDGNHALVGAPAADEDGSNSGSAYIFEKSDGKWLQRMQLSGNDTGSNDRFGSAVAIDGETAIVGAKYNDAQGTNSGSAYIFRKIDGSWQQEARLIASDGADYDHFGYSVAIDGETALIGAYGDDDNGATSGAAYVFTRSGSSWSQQTKLTASDAQTGDHFGQSVDLSGDTAIVGLPYDDVGASATGSAAIFERSGQTWTQTATLGSKDAAASDTFGISVALHNNMASVGAFAQDDGGTNAGAAYVFARYDNGTWLQRASLFADDPGSGDNFGSAVANHNNTTVVGAPHWDVIGNEGKVYYYNVDNDPQVDMTIQPSYPLVSEAATFVDATQDPIGGATTWLWDMGDGTQYTTQNATHTFTSPGPATINLTVTDVWGATSSREWVTPIDNNRSEFVGSEGGGMFGVSVDSDGDWLAVGQHRSDLVWMFQKDENGDWIRNTSLQANNVTDGDYFGAEVALDGDWLAISAYSTDAQGGNNTGRAYIYKHDGATWQEHQTLDPPVAGSWFGYDLALDAGTLLIGARFDDQVASNAGLAYFYALENGDWTLNHTAYPSDPSLQSLFSETLDLSGNRAVFGVINGDVDGSNDGAAVIFEGNGTGWEEVITLDASDGVDDDHFGSDVAIHNDTVVIGASGEDEYGSGAAYAYHWNGTAWVEEAKLSSGNGADHGAFGRGLHVRDDIAIVGDYGYVKGGVAGGRIYQYHRDDGDWTKFKQMDNPTPQHYDQFGSVLTRNGVDLFAGTYSGDVAELTDAGTVELLDSNDRPVAAFTISDASPTTLQSVTFTDASNDYVGGITNWTWDFGDGTSSYLQDPSHSYNDDGTYTVSLTVTDAHEASHTTSDTVTASNQGPTASAGPDQQAADDDGDGSKSVSLDGSLSSDADGTLANYTWNEGGTPVGYGATPTLGLAVGDHWINLTVTDDDGATSTDGVNITVNANKGPTAAFSYTPGDGNTVNFTDASDEPDGTITNWTWDFGDGNTSYEQHPSHTFGDPAEYNVTLTVKDNGGESDSVAATVDAGNDAPVADFTHNAGTSVKTGNTVTFTDASADNDGTITNWTWDFGDGNTSHAQNPTHAYDDDGSYTITLTATDDGGAAASATASVQVDNRAPSASFAKSASTVETQETVTFTDASNDQDGSISNWTWDFGDGANAYTKDTEHSYGDDGTYTINLTATDDDGATASMEQTITVANVGPDASFTHDAQEPSTTDTITFTDASSDSDGTITNWAWDFGDGNSSTAQNPSHSYGDDGTYTINLTATDDDGATASMEQSLTVTNTAPTSDFSLTPTSPLSGQSVSFNETSSDGDGSITTWSWDFGDGNSSDQANPTHAYDTHGTYTINLTVTDDDGATATRSHSIAVQNIAPVSRFSYSPSTISTATTVQFTDASTSSDDSIAAWGWDFGDNSTSTAQDPTHQFPDAGTYNVTLTVTDAGGATDQHTEQVQISNQPPNASFQHNSTNATVGDPIQFNDTSSDPDGIITNWAWDFGDGNTSNQQNPNHTFGAPGTYTVSLTVTDAGGASDSSTQQVQVANRPPSASFSHNGTNASAGDPVQFNDTSSDPDGIITNWTWDFGDGNKSYAQDPSHSWPASGNHTVSLVVTDDLGDTDVATTIVNVQEPPPSGGSDNSTESEGESGGGETNSTEDSNETNSTTGEGTNDEPLWAEIEANRSLAPVGGSIRFTANTTGNVTTTAWDLGDGNTSNTTMVDHAYNATGTYEVTLTITAANNTTATAWMRVHIYSEAAVQANLPSNGSASVRPSSDANITYSSSNQNASVDVNARSAASHEGLSVQVDAVNDSKQPTRDLAPVKYVEVHPGSNHKNITRVHIQIHYDEEDPSVQARGEDGLDIVYWNGTNWTSTRAAVEAGGHIDGLDGSYDLYVYAFGIDASANAAWVEVNHTSSFALAAGDASSGVSGGGGSGGGGGGSPTPATPLPIPAFSFEADGLQVQFKDESDPNGTTIASWAWDFGDAASDQQHPGHTFATDGEHNVELTVTTDDGVSVSTSKQVHLAASESSASNEPGRHTEASEEPTPPVAEEHVAEDHAVGARVASTPARQQEDGAEPASAVQVVQPGSLLLPLALAGVLALARVTKRSGKQQESGPWIEVAEPIPPRQEPKRCSGRPRRARPPRPTGRRRPDKRMRPRRDRTKVKMR